MDIRPLHIAKDEYTIEVYKACGQSSITASTVLEISLMALRQRTQNAGLDIKSPRTRKLKVDTHDIKSLKDFEREYILEAFAKFEYQGKETAKVLQLSPDTLGRKLKQYGLSINKLALNWTYEKFFEHAKKFPDIHSWFSDSPGIVRAAYRTQVVHRIKNELWSHI